MDVFAKGSPRKGPAGGMQGRLLPLTSIIRNLKNLREFRKNYCWGNGELNVVDGKKELSLIRRLNRKNKN